MPDVHKTLSSSTGTIVRSDALPWLREFLTSIPDLAPMIREYLQVRLVLDANIVNAEIGWRVGRRRDPAARSALHEAIVSGIIIPIAPTYLATEIEKHIVDIAARTDSSVEAVRREWADFRTLLRFYTPSRSLDPASLDGVDVDDLQYIAASRELGLPVYSRDSDIERMNAPVVTIAIDLNLRQYARGAAVQLAIVTGTTFTVTLGLEAIKAACGALGRAVRAFRRLPAFVQFLIVAATIILFVHPKSKAKLKVFWSSLCRVAPPLMDLATSVAIQFDRASNDVESAHEKIIAALPAQSKRSALMHARTICLTYKKPITTSELERRMRLDGQKSRAKHFGVYLRRILRSSGQFKEVASNTWILGVSRPFSE